MAAIFSVKIKNNMQKTSIDNSIEYRVVTNGSIYCLQILDPSGFQIGKASWKNLEYSTRFLFLIRWKIAGLRKREAQRRSASQAVWETVKV